MPWIHLHASESLRPSPPCATLPLALPHTATSLADNAVCTRDSDRRDVDTCRVYSARSPSRVLRLRGVCGQRVLAAVSSGVWGERAVSAPGLTAYLLAQFCRGCLWPRPSGLQRRRVVRRMLAHGRDRSRSSGEQETAAGLLASRWSGHTKGREGVGDPQTDKGGGESLAGEGGGWRRGKTVRALKPSPRRSPKPELSAEALSSTCILPPSPALVYDNDGGSGSRMAQKPPSGVLVPF